MTTRNAREGLPMSGSPSAQWWWWVSDLAGAEVRRDGDERLRGRVDVDGVVAVTGVDLELVELAFVCAGDAGRGLQAGHEYLRALRRDVHVIGCVGPVHVYDVGCTVAGAAV